MWHDVRVQGGQYLLVEPGRQLGKMSLSMLVSLPYWAHARELTGSLRKANQASLNCFLCFCTTNIHNVNTTVVKIIKAPLLIQISHYIMNPHLIL